MPHTIEVQYGDDHSKALAKCPPLEAISELIWNALDADATEVTVETFPNGLGGLDRIVISDDGHGIPLKFADISFGWIGASPKRHSAKTPQGRHYHGKLGKGRYKAFSLGSHVVWESHYRDGEQKMQSFEISGFDSHLRSLSVSDVASSERKRSGVIVTVSNMEKPPSSLDEEKAAPYLAAHFAPYLIGYPGTRIRYKHRDIDPRKELLDSTEYPITVNHKDDGLIEAVLKVYEWKDGKRNDIYLCSKNGTVIEQVTRGVRMAASFSAYLCSEYLETAENLILQDNRDTALYDLLREARKALRAHFLQKKYASLSEQIADLRTDEAYPYEGEPKTVIEVAERQVFDICAGKIYEFLPEFAESETGQKKITLSLIKAALEQSPSSLRKILTEVLKLPKEEQDEFALLLEKTSLSAILNLSKTVAERLQFINGFEQIVMDRVGKAHLKERKHLQHILEGELWLFGEEYAFTSPRGGDVSLKTVLEAHIKLLGRKELAPDADVKELADIPDLCLFRQFSRGVPGELEHLVVELKRPKLPLSTKHLTQVTGYADAVMNDPRFDKEKTRWKFIVVNTDLDEQVERKCKQKDRAFGHIENWDNCDVFVMRWSQIVQAAKGRLGFVQDQLAYSIDNNAEGMSFIQKKYEEYLPVALKAPAVGSEEEKTGDPQESELVGAAALPGQDEASSGQTEATVTT